MGKNKGARRPKTNTYSSASSNAAELLAAAGSTDPAAFIGFSQFTLDNTETASGSMDPLLMPLQQDVLPVSLRPIMKKLNSKRDPITKVKALEELCTWMENEAIDEDCLTLLPYWTKLYSKMSIDAEKRVRNLIQIAHGKLVHVLQKRVAPYLREWMPTWLNAMFDPQREVSTAAQESFVKLFPSEQKRTDVMFHSCTEIVRAAEHAVLRQRADTLSDPRFETPDDMQAKYVRVVACSFESLVHIMGKFDNSQFVKIRDSLLLIMDDSAMWNKVRDSDLLTRRASLRFLKQVMRCMKADVSPIHLDRIAAHVVSQVFASTNEIAVYECLWDTICAATLEFPELWELANKKSPIVADLYRFLKNCCYGSGAVSFPMIPVILQLWPSQLWEGVPDAFSKEIFLNWRNGLQSRYCNIPAMESWLKGYLECLFYLLCKEPDTDSAKSNMLRRDLDFLVELCCFPFLHANIRPSLFNSIDMNDVIADFMARCSRVGDETMKGVLRNYCNRFRTRFLELLHQKTVDGRQITLSAQEFCADIMKFFQFFTRCESQIPELGWSLMDTNGFFEVIETRIRETEDLQEYLTYVKLLDLCICTKSDRQPRAFTSFESLVPHIFGEQARWFYDSGSLFAVGHLTGHFLSNADTYQPIWASIVTLLEKLKVNHEQLASFMLEILKSISGSFRRDLSMPAFGKLYRSCLAPQYPFYHELLEYGIGNDDIRILSEEDTCGVVQDLTDAIVMLVGVVKNNDGMGLDTDEAMQLLRALLRFANSKTAVFDLNNCSLLSPLLDLVSFFRITPTSLDVAIMAEVIWDTISISDNAHRTKELVQVHSKALDAIKSRTHYSTFQRSVILLELTGSIENALGNVSSWRDLEYEISPKCSVLNFLPPFVDFEMTQFGDCWKYRCFLRNLAHVVVRANIPQLHAEWATAIIPRASIGVILLGMLIQQTASVELEDEQTLIALHEFVGNYVRQHMSYEAMQNLVKWFTTGKLDDPEEPLIRAFNHYFGGRDASNAHWSLIGLLRLLCEFRGKDLSLLLYQYSSENLHAISETSMWVLLCCLPVMKDLSGFLRKLLDEMEYEESNVRGMIMLLAILQSQRTDISVDTTVSLTRKASSSAENDFECQRILWLFLKETLKKGTRVVDELLQNLSPVFSRNRNVRFHQLQFLNSRFEMETSVSFELFVEALGPRIVQEFKSAAAFFSCNSQSSEAYLEQVSVAAQNIYISIGMHLPFEELLILLDSSNVHTRCASYRILSSLVEKLCSEIAFTIDAKGSALDLLAEENVPNLPESLLSVLHPRTSEDFPEHVGYVLSWLLILQWIRSSSPKLRPIYAEKLRQCDGLLNGVFAAVFARLHVNSKPIDLSRWQVDNFVPEEVANKSLDSPYLYAYLYWNLLKIVPHLVRGWYVSCQNRKLVVAVEKYTEKYFSASLITQELAAVTTDGDNFTVKTSRSGGQGAVRCSYVVDETTLEFLVKLPACYPLRAATVEGSQQVVAENRWRRWLVGLTASLSSHEGTIANAISTWKQNADKHFEGIEDCAICYSVVGTIDKSLPSKQCRTCKHKFHAGCLYKWFKSSNNSTCPLCRNVFGG